jgi:hypothetical protein
MAAACATDDYNFVPEPKAEHCANDLPEPELGETDVDCGGADCKGCELGEGCAETSDCREGQCIGGYCQAAGCDNGAHDEGETGVDCGGACKPCPTDDPCTVPADCISKVCTDEKCAAPSCEDGIINGTETGRDCGGGLCDGCGTGSPCNEATDCKSGVCNGEARAKKCEVSCLEGTAECDGDTSSVAEECESNVFTDVMHCGDCETTCELAHAEQSCVSGRCQIGSCKVPYDNCDNDVETGCETNRRTSLEHCGSCGNECSAQNGTPSCENGECLIDCESGFLDCNDMREDGCERNIDGDVENCGECENVCPFDEGETPFCVDGECGATVCPAGRGNCDGRGSDCEKDLTNDVMNCGRCGGACTVFKGSPSCGSSGCRVRSCDDGYANCNASDPDGGYANGCETNTNTDNLNCGGCNMPCPTGRSCSGGACVCNGGLTLCSGACVDTTTSNSNCGGCNNICTGGRSCVSSVCQCPAGQTFCGGVCVSMQTDPMNCGMCGRSCQTPAGTTTNTCMAGACVPMCGTLRASCDMEPWDGCEENLASNNANCGACGRVCATSAGTTANTCNASGACIPTCATGFDSCDSQPWNGCETNLTSLTNCGICGRDCADSACGTTGSTSCCVPTSGALTCQATITTVTGTNAMVSGSVVGPKLDAATGSAPLGAIANHNLQAGTNRIVLLAVASETGGEGNQASHPDVVTYGGVNMLAGPVQFDGAANFWAPDIYLYYLTDATGLSGTGNKAIVIDGSSSMTYAGAPGLMIASLVQFNGVKQTNPFGADSRRFTLDTASDNIAGTVNVTVTGSRVFSFATGLWPSTLNAAVTIPPGSTAGPAANSLLPSTADLNGAGTIMRAASVSVGSGSATSLPTVTSPGYTVTWSATSQSLAQVTVVLLPASQ